MNEINLDIFNKKHEFFLKLKQILINVTDGENMRNISTQIATLYDDIAYTYFDDEVKEEFLKKFKLQAITLAHANSSNDWNRSPQAEQMFSQQKQAIDFLCPLLETNNLIKKLKLKSPEEDRKIDFKNMKVSDLWNFLKGGLGLIKKLFS
ncbi:MAG: hypothetical protein WC748_04820 [Legionellales bacterium]|jgi:hypothetical protein